MIDYDRRSFCHHEREVRVHDRLSIERAVLAGGGFERAKTILSANEERQALLELALVRREKADQTAEMIVMAVAQHHGIDARRVDLQNRHVVEERLRLVAEIDQDVPNLVAAPRLGVHGQSPLADQLHARRGVLAQIAAGISLDGQSIPLLGRNELDELVIRYDSHREAVDLWRFGGQRLRLCHSRAVDQGADQCGYETPSAGT